MEKPLLLKPLSKMSRKQKRLAVINESREMELDLTEAERLLQELTTWKGIAGNNIEAYDNWIKEILPRQIEAISIRNKDYIVRFIDVKTFAPRYMDGSQLRNLTPAICIDQGESYLLEIKVTPVFINLVNGTVNQSDTQITIGSVPLMVGSLQCWLRHKTDNELIEAGACISDPFGYFIIKGSERFIVTQERLRSSVYLTRVKAAKGSTVETRVTVPNVMGSPVASTIVSIAIGKRLRGLKVALQSTMQSKHIPLFTLFRIIYPQPHNGLATFNIGPNGAHYTTSATDEYLNHCEVFYPGFDRTNVPVLGEIEIYIALILKFARAEDRADIMYILQASLAKDKGIQIDSVAAMIKDLEFRSIENKNTDQIYGPVYYAIMKKLKKNANDTSAQIDITPKPGMTPKDKIDTAIEQVTKSVFTSIAAPVLPDEYYASSTPNYVKSQMMNDYLMKRRSVSIQKAYHLAMTACRTCEYLIGKRAADDPDSWGNKKLELGARSMEILFSGLLSEMMGRVVADITDLKNADLNSVKHTFNNQNTKHIAEDFISAFNSNSWGLKNRTMKENITDIVKRDTPLAVMSQVGRINTPTSRRANLPSIRMVQPSSLGIVCPFETPEGDTIGLVKNIARTAYISKERNPDELLAYIEVQGLYSNSKLTQRIWSPDTPFPVLINGVIRFWVAKTEPYEMMLKAARRSRVIHEDICVFNNTIDRVLELFCDGSRPMRPLLVIDPVTRRLKIDQPPPQKEAGFPSSEAGEEPSSAPRLNMWGEDPETLLRTGCMELVDAREQEYIKLAERVEMVRERATLEDLTYQERLRAAAHEALSLRESIAEIDALIAVNRGDPEEKEKLELKLKSLPSDVLESEKVYNNVIDTIRTKFGEMPYTHSEIHPSSMFSLATANVPYPNHIPGPRIGYTAGMGKQALGEYNMNHHLRFDSSFKRLERSSRAWTETEGAAPAKLDIMPCGQTMIVAFMALRNNAEDGIVVKKEAIDAGKFRMVKYITHKCTRKSINQVEERFERPMIGAHEKEGRYAAITENGFPRLDSYIRYGDCVVGRTRSYKEGQQVVKVENASIFAGIGEEGYVDRIRVSYSNNICTVKVRLRALRLPEEGDKFALRYSQKGVISEVVASNRDFRAVNESNLPRIVGGPNDGLVPDIIINPKSMPSRMTTGLPMEMVASKGAIYAGVRVNVTGFGTFEEKRWRTILEDNGMDPDGEERMEWSDGTPIPTKIFVGPAYYQALKHHVADKIQVRALGTIKPLTHQPVRGRASEGGIRVGEMERDGMISHGSTGLMLDRLFLQSDFYKMPVCMKCGLIATVNLSLQVEKKHCGICAMKGDKMEIGMLRVPYVIKLISQLLSGANIKLRLNCVKVVSDTGRPEELHLE